MEISFFTTSGCHLCEVAYAMLLDVSRDTPLVINSIDIAGSDELMARYGVRIPVVLRIVEQRELGWPFNEEELSQFLAD